MGLYEALLLVVLVSSIWVFIDAPSQGLSWTWGLGCIALWIVAFPWYLVVRSRQTGSARAAGVNVQTLTPQQPHGQWEPDPRDPEGTERWREGTRWTTIIRPRERA